MTVPKRHIRKLGLIVIDIKRVRLGNQIRHPQAATVVITAATAKALAVGALAKGVIRAGRLTDTFSGGDIWHHGHHRHGNTDAD